MARGKRKDVYEKLAEAAVAYSDAHASAKTQPESKRAMNMFSNRLDKLLAAVEELADEANTYSDDAEATG